jgi:hypothetical protein
MDFQVLSLSSPNDGNGDPLRDGGLKINSNFLLAAETFNAMSTGIDNTNSSFLSRLNVTSVWVQSLFNTKADSSALNNNVGSLSNRINALSAYISAVDSSDIYFFGVHSTWISSLAANLNTHSTWISSIGASVQSLGGGGGGGGSGILYEVKARPTASYTGGLITPNWTKVYELVGSRDVTSGFMAINSGILDISVRVRLTPLTTRFTDNQFVTSIRKNGVVVAREFLLINSFASATDLTLKCDFHDLVNSGDFFDSTFQSVNTNSVQMTVGSIDNYFHARLWSYP